jgi:hypothetical protein
MADASSQAGRCATCRHWTRERNVCQRIASEYDATSDDLAVLRGNSFLMTTANFGCVLHEPRKENHGNG